MTTDQQVRLLMSLIKKGLPLATAAVKAGMSEGTARKYRRLGKLPSEVGATHGWRTRPDLTSVSCPVRLSVVSPLLARRTEFTVPSRTVRAIGTPGADEVNAVELECGNCDSAARPRPTTHPRDRSHVTTAVDRSSGITWDYRGAPVVATPNLREAIVSVIDMS